jgi:hypothetical protein
MDNVVFDLYIHIDAASSDMASIDCMIPRRSCKRAGTGTKEKEEVYRR